MTIEFCGITDLGKVRGNNEDSFLIDEEAGIFLVADGMGGANAGEVASKMAVDIISNNLSQSLEKRKQSDITQVMIGKINPAISDSANYLVSSIRLANKAIYEAGQANDKRKGMGTTIVAALVEKNSIIIAWVGDSRIYLVSQGNILQLTKDHTLVQEQINQGLITKTQADDSIYKNILTRALGSAENIEVDICDVTIQNGDYLVLCSDGLSHMIGDESILAAVLSFRKTHDICEQFIKLANDAGGKDNITAIVLYKKSEHLLNKLLKIVNK